MSSCHDYSACHNRYTDEDTYKRSNGSRIRKFKIRTGSIDYRNDRQHRIYDTDDLHDTDDRRHLAPRYYYTVYRKDILYYREYDKPIYEKASDKDDVTDEVHPHAKSKVSYADKKDDPAAPVMDIEFQIVSLYRVGDRFRVDVISHGPVAGDREYDKIDGVKNEPERLDIETEYYLEERHDRIYDNGSRDKGYINVLIVDPGFYPVKDIEFKTPVHLPLYQHKILTIILWKYTFPKARRQNK